MSASKLNPAVRFLLSVTVFHVVTYFIFGFLASSALRYAELFELPVIRDYYKPFGSVSSYLGPVVQVLRGLIFGAALLPFRGVLEKSRHGWLYTWALFIGIGILGTPSAAPSSIEGAIYSKLPLWFHLIGFPEILLQTLAFSLLLHNGVSEYKLLKTERATAAVGALSAACFSFIGYTVVSIGFALLAKADIGASGADLKVLGQFVLPLLLTFAAALARRAPALAVHAMLYVGSALSLIAYQTFVLGSGNWAYAVAAPIIPVLISLALAKRKAA